MGTEIASFHDVAWYSEVPRSIRRQTVAGLLLMGATFGGFGYWGLTAPLSAAIIAQGSFVATGQNKIVQHFGGGVIKELLVDEGSRVVAGQPLLRLDETAAMADERQLYLRRARLEAVVARLRTPLAGDAPIAFPAMIEENLDDADIAAIRASQETIFASTRVKLRTDVGLLEQNAASLRFRTEGYAQQLDSVHRQLDLLREELVGKQELLDKGLLRRPEISAIQRAIADADGQAGRLQAEISETNAQITRVEQQVAQAKDTYGQAALEELQTVEAELDTVREQMLEARNVLDRTTIAAPAAGTVVRLYYHSVGGVVENGKPIMEILPSDVPLIIETQIPRTDIDLVRVSEDASVRLTALNQRTTPILTGKVFYVSADAIQITAGMENREVYVARIEVSPAEIARVPGFAPTPGMPAEVMVKTDERTFFDYITKPIRDSMSRAFNEH